ncbi:MAG: glutamate--cysteine ligase, partial [Planctomycetota bacterium]
TGVLDSRMHMYCNHCQAVPSLIGQVIPEPLFDEAGYRRTILEPIARDIRKRDPDGVMQVDFLNARGAIARFDRGSIELRVMDVQEYPGADVAICAAVIAVVRALYQERWGSRERQQSLTTEQLRRILDATISRAESAVIADTEWLGCLGIDRQQVRAGRVWELLLDRLRPDDAALDNLFAPLELILDKGCLATRICAALGNRFSIASIRDVYRDLVDSLQAWQPFHP